MPCSRVRASASARIAAACAAGRGVGDDLGQHRVVEHRHHRPVDDAGVDAHARRGRAARTRSRVVGHLEAVDRARPAAASPWRDPRRRAAPRSNVRCAAGGSASSRPPSATCSCSSTRSSPVVSSVTGCSTCRRVFISRKKKSPCVVGHELDGARAGVADRLGGQPGGLEQLGAHARECVRRAATAPPR